MNSLEAAMRILKLLDKRRRVLRVGEISRALSLQKSTVSRLLRTLSEHEFLERERDGQGYTVGRRVLALSDLYLAPAGRGAGRRCRAVAAPRSRARWCAAAG